MVPTAGVGSQHLNGAGSTSNFELPITHQPSITLTPLPHPTWWATAYASSLEQTPYLEFHSWNVLQLDWTLRIHMDTCRPIQCQTRTLSSHFDITYMKLADPFGPLHNVQLFSQQHMIPTAAGRHSHATITPIFTAVQRWNAS